MTEQSDSFDIAELYRRLSNMIRVGIVSAADYQKARVRVKDGEFISGWVPWITPRANGQEAAWSAPEVGERVVLFSPLGEPSLGVALPALFCRDHPAPAINPDVITTQHKDGGHITYDREASRYVIQPPNDGRVEIIVGRASITVDNEDIDIVADQAVTLSAPTVSVTADTATIDADTVNLGGTGGKKVARVGDAVDPQTMKIKEGSNVVKAK